MKRLSEIKVKKQSEVLTSEEMKKIIGGSAVCYFLCRCTRGSGASHYVKGDCSGPSDRTSLCSSGLRYCYELDF